MLSYSLGGPRGVKDPTSTTGMKSEFGKPMRKHFLFQHSWLNMNHGSFGAIPKQVRDTLHEKQQLVESSPDLFIRLDYGKHLLESRRSVADLIDAPLSSVVLVPNATTGVDTVLRNLEYTYRDHIVTFSTVYGASERTTLHLSESTGVQVSRIPLRYPLSDADIVMMFEKTVEKIRNSGDRVKVAVFDTISFEPGVRMPFASLTQMCRDLKILSCVDGAHCVGQIAISMTTLDPDFFVSNLHKWLFVPRGCAVLYVPPRNQSLMRTTFPTSWGYSPKCATCHGNFQQSPQSQSDFETLFQSVGTMDYSPFLCVTEALRFRQEICGGEDAILQYNSKLAKDGGLVMADILGTEILDNQESTLTRGLSMVNVLLPLDHTALDTTTRGTVIEWMSRTLISDYHTFVPTFEHAGQLWVRVSAQVYLELEDFAFLGQVLKKVCNQFRRTGHLDDQ